MNIKLAILCARLWLGGFLGMILSRGVFGHGPGELFFDISARLCAIGWLTYCLLGLLHVVNLSTAPQAADSNTLKGRPRVTVAARRS